MSLITLTDQQRAAISMVFNHRLSILTGKPGTGKTTTVRAILDTAEKQGWRVIQAAPTGKAAKRMIESTGRYAATIHSTLGCEFENGDFTFLHNENHPLPADLVIVDESSMISTDLMYHLIKAINPEKTRALFVGDTGQLPSVGGGAVLRDMLASGTVPHVELDIIHRNAGKIVEACAAIHDGKPFFPEGTLDLEAENPVNLIHIDMGDTAGIHAAIKAIVCERMPLRGYDSTWDVQVISPVNSKGGLSCEAINAVLRDALNPIPSGPLGPEKDEKFRPGDKVINTKNMKVKTTCGGQELIVNGDIGKVIDLDKKHIVVEFYDPPRIVKISRGDNHLLHAYCITCHRFQGSEAPVIIIPLHKQFGYFTNRSWIYTAISRAKQICITIGDFSAINSMINNTKGDDRLTMLKEKIVDAAGRIALEKEFEGI